MKTFTQDIKQRLLSNQESLFLAPSTIPEAGRGLKTKKNFQKGDLLTQYCGWIISRGEARSLRDQGAHSHVNTLDSHTYLLGVETPAEIRSFPPEDRGYASFVNHDPQKKNCEFVTIEGRRLLRATKDIEAGSELFVSYGRNYFKSDYSRTRAGKELRKQLVASKPRTSIDRNSLIIA